MSMTMPNMVNPMMAGQNPMDLGSLFLNPEILKALKGKEDDSDDDDDVLKLMDKQRMMLENYSDKLRKGKDDHLRTETKQLMKKIDKLEDELVLRERQIDDEERRFESKHLVLAYLFILC